MKKSRWLAFAGLLLLFLATMMFRHLAVFKNASGKGQLVFTQADLPGLLEEPELVTVVPAPVEDSILIGEAAEPPKGSEITLIGYQLPVPPLPQTNEPPIGSSQNPMPLPLPVKAPEEAPKSKASSAKSDFDILMAQVVSWLGGNEEKKTIVIGKEEEKKNTLTIGIGINFSTGPIFRVDYKRNLGKPADSTPKKGEKSPGKLPMLDEGLTPAGKTGEPPIPMKEDSKSQKEETRKQSLAPMEQIPLTGSFPCVLDSQRNLAFPPEVLAQLGQVEKILVSPGPDTCLWITTAELLPRLNTRVEKSIAPDPEVLAFRRLFFGQMEKLPLLEGKARIPDRLAAFAALDSQVALVGVEDHLELWDLNNWRNYLLKTGRLEKP